MSKVKGEPRSNGATGESVLANTPWYDALRYYIVPVVFPLIFTVAAQWLIMKGRGESSCPFDLSQCSRLQGNAFSWILVGSFIMWACLSLWIPAKEFVGPPTPDGYRPLYSHNGVAYYICSIIAFSAAQLIYPDLCEQIYDNMPEILGCLNTVAFALCVYLVCVGRGNQMKSGARRPMLYDFYRGSEIHPRLLGMDVKQLTNCRLGMMMWQLLVVAFFIAGCQKHGVTPGAVVSFTLQTVYLTKFFHWETGYFNTLDITYDRAGYYLCWGCLVWVPSMYTFHSYHMVQYPSLMSLEWALVTFASGFSGILLNYRVDYEKQVFAAWWRRHLQGDKQDECVLWDKPVTYVQAAYRDDSGATKYSALLTSGFWGIARHTNYLFELLSAFSWCLPASVCNCYLSMGYFYFLTALLVHRIYRDEDKCRTKYGESWKKYCQVVPYRMIPYVY